MVFPHVGLQIVFGIEGEAFAKVALIRQVEMFGLHVAFDVMLVRSTLSAHRAPVGSSLVFLDIIVRILRAAILVHPACKTGMPTVSNSKQKVLSRPRSQLATLLAQSTVAVDSSKLLKTDAILRIYAPHLK